MARPVLGLISLILLGAAVLFQFFIILSGGVDSSPENKIYFLEAETNGMNARNPSRWTYWSICSVANNLNVDCGKDVPALPFDPTHRSNFGSAQGVPEQFLNNRRTYYYLSRFAWVFFLIALFFSVFAFLFGSLAICTRLGAWFSSGTTSFALFFQTVAASLMTAWTVKARNVFQSAGHESHLGKYAYGFSWGAVALLFLSMLSFAMAGGKSSHSRNRDSYATGTSTRRGGFFRRRRATKEYV